MLEAITKRSVHGSIESSYADAHSQETLYDVYVVYYVCFMFALFGVRQLSSSQAHMRPQCVLCMLLSRAHKSIIFPTRATHARNGSAIPRLALSSRTRPIRQKVFVFVHMRDIVLPQTSLSLLARRHVQPKQPVSQPATGRALIRETARGSHARPGESYAGAPAAQFPYKAFYATTAHAQTRDIAPCGICAVLLVLTRACIA